MKGYTSPTYMNKDITINAVVMINGNKHLLWEILLVQEIQEFFELLPILVH